MNRQLRMRPEEDRVTSPAVTVLLVSLAALGVFGAVLGLVYGRYEVAVIAFVAIAGLERAGPLWKTAWVARFDSWFERNVAEPWLVIRDRSREAASRQLGRTRLIALVICALLVAIIVAMALAIVAGLRVPAGGAAPVGLVVSVVFNVASVSVFCHWMLRILMRDWNKKAATPLSCGAVKTAAEFERGIQRESAVRARSVLWVVVTVAGAAAAVAAII